MSASALIALILSFLMALPTACVSEDTYVEITISDPVLTDTEGSEPDALFDTIDLTGLDIALGGGANGAGDKGLLTLGLGADDAFQSALITLENDEFTLCMDNLPMLITMPLPTQEEMDQLFMEYTGMSMAEMARTFAASEEVSVTPADIFEMMGNSIQNLKADKKIYKSEETFLDGTLVRKVTRIDFSMTAEDVQEARMQTAAVLESSGMEDLAEEFDDLAIGAAAGTLCYSHELISLSLTCDVLYEDGTTEPVDQEIFVYIPEEDWQFYWVIGPVEGVSLLLEGHQQTENGTAVWEIALGYQEGEIYESGVLLQGEYTTDEKAFVSDTAVYAEGEQILSLHMEKLDTAEKLYLEFDLLLQDDFTDQRVLFTYDADVTVENGIRTRKGPMHLEIADGYAESDPVPEDFLYANRIVLDCGITLRDAPLDSFMPVLPQDLPRVSYDQLTETHQTQLFGALMEFVMPITTLEGVNDLVTVNITRVYEEDADFVDVSDGESFSGGLFDSISGAVAAEAGSEAGDEDEILDAFLDAVNDAAED